MTTIPHKGTVYRDERLLVDMQAGKWPSIHDDMAQVFGTEVIGSRVLDLCCSIGILGHRLRSVFGSTVVGVEMDPRAIAVGAKYGIGPSVSLKVTPSTLPQLVALVKEHALTVLVARRCLSEVFYPDQAWARDFCEQLRDAGIRECLIQGRLWTPAATHPIPHTDAEVALLAPTFTPRARYRDVAYLTATP